MGLCCSVQASLVVSGLSYPKACGILVPQPGIEPMSLAFEGRFLTTGPPGKFPRTLLSLEYDSGQGDKMLIAVELVSQ